MNTEPAAIDPTRFEHYLESARARRGVQGDPYVGTAGGAACGDVVRISVRPEGARLRVSGFDAAGCAAAHAAVAAASEIVDGACLLEAMKVSAHRIASELGGLSAGKFHAAALACDALAEAIGAAASAGALALGPSLSRTLVAISGGVDSAVAAWLCAQNGEEPVCVTLKLWSDEQNDGAKSCCSLQAAYGARALAHGMGLAHVTLDLRSRFRSQVVDDFVTAHAGGKTPNPCIRCNGLVRFDSMLELAGDLGATRLATGHYARLEHDGEGTLLRAAVDANKDQSYMLARLDPKICERLYFPLGELTKPQVREIAKRAQLPVADKPESQDLCFLAGTRRESFLKRHGSRPASSQGEIVDGGGRVLGHHSGQDQFTVGQRRGLGLAAASPLYVLEKDARSNRVVVGPRDELLKRAVQLEGARLYRRGSCVDAVKLRYRQSPVGCSAPALGAGEHRRLSLELSEPVAGIAPGQVACLLAGDRVVGFGTIA